MDAETYEVIGKLTGVKLSGMQEKPENEQEEQDMWKAIEDLIEDGRVEGRHDKANQLISIIGSIMEKLHCTLEEACDIAGQSLEEYMQAKELLSN